MTVEEYWNAWLATQPEEARKERPYGGEIQFGFDEAMSAWLTPLVLSGQKQATTSALESFQIDNEKLPVAGHFYVLTDWNDNPLGIIEDVKVDILPFDQVPWSMAQKEGEDESLESWRENHIEAFQEDADLMGYTFRMDMPVVFEEFRLVYKGEL